MLAAGDRLADELLAQQYQTVSGLDGTLGYDEARCHARWLVRAYLGGITERRPPAAEEIGRCEAFGARRARQGVPVPAILQGYHHAHRELWQRVVQEVTAQPGLDPALLAATFVHGLRWLDLVVEAITRGGEAQAAEVLSARERARRRLIGLLESAPLDPAENGGDRARSLATTLGLDPDGPFVAVHGGPDGESAPQTRLVQPRPPGPGRAAGTGAGPDAELDAELGPVRPGERWGIGAERQGLPGARRSIADAKLAHAALPERGGRLDFAESWSLCLPQAHREAIDPLLDTAREVARSRPYLLDAVVAFADARFSVSPAARALLVHPNTLSYRLDQWRRLTGLDPRTVNGLTQSLYLAR
jgi:hypothetical protein